MPQADRRDHSPVAIDIDWQPLRAGGASFKTHRLRIDGQNIFLHRSLGLVVFAL